MGLTRGGVRIAAEVIVEPPMPDLIAQRHDLLEAWKQAKARCDIDQLPECDPNLPPEKQTAQCCMLAPRPVSVEEQAQDAQRKAEILAEIEAAKVAAEEEKSGKGKRRRRGR